MSRPTKAAIYIRVSSPDQVENFSLEAQEQAARQYLDAHGWQLHQIYADEGISARTTKRPSYQLMLSDAKLRQFDVVLVHKLDRLFRNLSNLLDCVQELDKRDVRLVSVSEDIDFSSASGRMLLTNLGMIGEFYSNNLREETIKGKRQRAMNGLWNSCIPFGYQRGECEACSNSGGKGACPNTGEYGVCPGQMMVPHPVNSIGIKEAFELHAQGRSYQEVANYLNKQGYKPLSRSDDRSLGRFSKETMRSMLQNETYLGFVKYKGELYPGLHTPLVTRETFELSQQVCRDAATFRSGPQQRQHYLLSGLIRCAGCDCVMRGVSMFSVKHGLRRYYRDAGRERGMNCNQKRVIAEAIETQVEEVIASMTLPPAWQERSALLAQATPEVEQLEERRRMLEAKQQRLKKLYLRGDITEKQYEKQGQQLQRELQAVRNQQITIDEHYRELVADYE
ncbi:recombinase family protein, partial [Chloroflexota bacterium]